MKPRPPCPSKPDSDEPVQASGPTGWVRKVLAGPYALTAGSSVVVALSNVAAYKAVALLGTATTFYEYSSARRLLSFALPVLVLGFGVSLPLRISRNNNRNEAASLLKLQFLLSTVLITMASLAVTLTRPEVLDRYVNGLSRPTIYSALLAGLSLNYTAILYAYHRGFQQYGLGNRVVLFSNGAFPVLAVLLTRYGSEAILLCWGAMNLGLTAFSMRRIREPLLGHISDFWRFISTSLTRIPGDIAYAALFLLPVLQASSYGTTTAKSVFNYFFVILGFVAAAAAPLSIVLLPTVGSLVASHQFQVVRRILYQASLAALLFGVCLFAFLRLFSGPVTANLMSEQYRNDAWIIRQLAPSVVGLSFFVFLKSVVDGLRESAITAYISVFAVALLLALGSVLAGDLGGLIRTVNATFTFLGSATLLAGLVLVHSRKLAR